MPHTDAELVHESRQGRAESFGSLVERHQRLVRAVALCGSGDLDTAEELAQEAFVTAWTRLDELREPAHFSAWVCGIARNLARGARRHRARHAPMAGEPAERLADVPVDAPSPLDAAIERQEHALLGRALDRVPENYREPLVLFYGEDLSVAEVASQLGLSRDTVKQRLSRGRRYLERGMHEMLRDSLARPVAVGAGVFAAIAGLPVARAAAGVQGLVAPGVEGAQSSLGAGFWGGSAKLALGSALAASITLCALVVTPLADRTAPRGEIPALDARIARVSPAQQLEVAPEPVEIAAPEPVEIAVAEPTGIAAVELVAHVVEPDRARGRRGARAAASRPRLAMTPAARIAPALPATGTVLEDGPTRVSRAHAGPSMSLYEALSVPGEPELTATRPYEQRLPIEPPDLAARILDIDDI